ncbi:MAG: SDR family NAD(P)-dependent oxidoreductase, partial [Mucinivorans sp.]
MDYRGKIVVVTGASSGIGLALVREFHGLGAHVVMGARSFDKLQEIETELVGSISVLCDVSKDGDCRELIEAAIERFGGVDILINNAGISMRALFDDV